jgi:Flp pilus assembly protein TadD
VEFDAAIAAGGAASASFANRGQTLCRLGKYAEALTDFNRALELEPHNAMLLADRGTAHLELEDPAAAVIDLSRALELEPADIGALAHGLRAMLRSRSTQRRSPITGVLSSWSQLARART